MAKFIEPVFTGKLADLIKARELLLSAGIPSKHSSPRKSEGILKVSRREAGRARKLLDNRRAGAGRIISAEEASWFFCPACQAPLSEGTKYCAACGFFVGDPHAL